MSVTIKSLYLIHSDVFDNPGAPHPCVCYGHVIRAIKTPRLVSWHELFTPHCEVVPSKASDRMSNMGTITALVVTTGSTLMETALGQSHGPQELYWRLTQRHCALLDELLTKLQIFGEEA